MLPLRHSIAEVSVAPVAQAASTEGSAVPAAESVVAYQPEDAHLLAGTDAWHNYGNVLDVIMEHDGGQRGEICGEMTVHSRESRF